MTGLVLANSAQFTFHALAMWFLLHRSLGQVGDSTVKRTFLRSMLAGGVMALVVYGVARGLQLTSFASALPGEIMSVAVPVAFGMGIYFVALRLLGVDEIHAIQSGLMRRLKRSPT
jgi:putative peptidoglycan lipid II flippase